MPIVTWLWGGFSVDKPTLNRFYSLHYLLPFMIAGVVLLHIWALHVPGNGNPTGVDVKDKQDTVPFHPYYTIKDTFGLSVFLILFAWLVFFIPNYLGHPDNYIPANPLQTPAQIVPEWYFLPFYAILRAIPNKLHRRHRAVRLDRHPGLPAVARHARGCARRPSGRSTGSSSGSSCSPAIGLGYLGSQPPTGGYVIAARILTFYYFAHFLIVLPVLGLIERPRPLPASITESVLAKSGHAAQAGG